MRRYYISFYIIRVLIVKLLYYLNVKRTFEMFTTIVKDYAVYPVTLK